MMKWESESSIPVNLNISQGQSTPFTHCSYSYPAMSSQRDQPEHRCIDPGHTLANMRSQISRHGYTFCKTAAFKRVSESNHSVLPKSILEDKLDRQSIRIAKRFFSKEVQDELAKTMTTMKPNLLAWCATGMKHVMSEALTFMSD